MKMSKSFYSSVQSPAIPFTATAMELLEVLEQMILAGKRSFRNVPVCAGDKFV